MKNKESSSNPPNSRPTIASDKNAVRAQVENLRRNSFSRDIFPQTFRSLLNQQWFLKAKNISTYVSQDFEFCTYELFQLCQEHHKNVYAPVIDSKKLTFQQIEDWHILHKNDKEISEPHFGQIIHPEHIDVFFLPMVAFDWHGNRLGRGGGYFDRLFANHLITGIKIGVAFEYQSFPLIPSYDHDIKMDYILTEKQLRKMI